MKAQQTEKYDHTANKKLCNYVRMKYRNQLSNGAMQVYLLGIPYLEQKKCGFCKQVTANYGTIAEAACKDASGLKKPLLELNGVLCEIQLGKPIRNGKIATVIRRYTLDELKEARLETKIIDHRPLHARELSEMLESRSFVYGDQSTCRPYWKIGKTGRVISHKPNVQGDSKQERAEKLCRGLKSGQVLFDLDIKGAEPSIIQQILGFEFDSDPYELLAKINGVDRERAKPELNKLAYAKSAVSILKYWKPKAQKQFATYAEAIDLYKAKLWDRGKPLNRQRRFADTLGGTRIYADKNERNHKGKLFNWHVQGTVADIINQSSIEIIERGRSEGWRFLFPVHDSVYVMGETKHADELKNVITGKARELGLDLSVRINVCIV